MSSLGEYLSLDELAQFTGESSETLLAWQALGLVGKDAAGYTSSDIERVRATQVCIRRGLTAEDVSSVEGLWSLNAHYQGRLQGFRSKPAGTLLQVAERIGMDGEQAKRLWLAAGLSEQGENADRVDVAMLKGSKLAMDGGFPEEGILEMFRVLEATLGRAAEAMQRTAHVYQLEVPIAQGLTADAAATRADAMGPQLPQMAEPMVLYFLRKAMAREAREDLAVHIAIQSGKASFSEVPGRVRRAIAYIDLSDFTPLTATRSDAEGAAVLSRFRDIVHRHVTRAAGSIVKQIGDEFMLAFHNAGEAVDCLASIHRAASAEPQFPAVRSGLHVGEMLYRDGDYVGTVPNTAARIRGVAGRHQLMVSGEARREAGKVQGVDFVRVGRRALKGLPADLEVFEAVLSDEQDAVRRVDPVCGIELAEAEVAARLSLDAIEHAFCSDGCLRNFVMSPEKFLEVNRGSQGVG